MGKGVLDLSYLEANSGGLTAIFNADGRRNLYGPAQEDRCDLLRQGLRIPFPASSPG